MHTAVDDKSQRWREYWPVLTTFLVVSVFVVLNLARNDWNSLSLVRIGTRFSQGDPAGTEGYDGQFAYYMALDLAPERAASYLDIPAYRYQRIIYPLLVRILSLGYAPMIPWMMMLVNLAAQIAGAFAICRYLLRKKIPVRYSLIYGLWVGLVVGVTADLYEPLAFMFVAFAWSERSKDRKWASYLLLTLALLCKETVLPFLVAAGFADILCWRSVLKLGPPIASGLAYACWQGWLWWTFGMTGLASGGANATGFEWIPFGGFFRIGTVDMRLLFLFGLLFGPIVIFPTIAALIAGLRAIVRGNHQAHTLALVLNALLIMILPFSTFREPSGLMRIATGLVFSILIFSAHADSRRALNYGMFWIPLIVMSIQ